MVLRFWRLSHQLCKLLSCARRVPGAYLKNIFPIHCEEIRAKIIRLAICLPVRPLRVKIESCNDKSGSQQTEGDANVYLPDRRRSRSALRGTDISPHAFELEMEWRRAKIRQGRRPNSLPGGRACSLGAKEDRVENERLSALGSVRAADVRPTSHRRYLSICGSPPIAPSRRACRAPIHQF